MVRSEPAMTDEDGNFLKSLSALRLVKESVEPLVKKGSLQYTEEIINQARQEAGLYGKDICGHCTTHNAVPCKPGNGLCHYDKDGNCRFHDTSDPLKAFKICPKGICNRIVRIIKSRHRFHSPTFKNTDARRWFQNPFEIMKCFIPTDGYQAIETVEKTDLVGLLSVIINCKSFQSLVAADLGAQHNIFDKMREIRNKTFHSADYNITDRDLQEHMKLMLSILNDAMFLAHDKDAQTAAEKIQEIADSSVHVYCGEEVQDPDLNPESDFSWGKTIRENAREPVRDTVYMVHPPGGMLEVSKGSQHQLSLGCLVVQARRARFSATWPV
ncbi:uncharacterized protein LOC132739990 [Ruditapes philippinarum]|uniref:uncharacterized protein LOC132739990 n=1 Tax=Ruditapes philippinarum TaxID=129788 RepID=UPI00295A8FBA|nr:uncharacterized protein LOC132739990 [Ruditapes philippinarum]